MTTKTRTQLVNEALSKLPGLLPSGQSPEAEDQTLVDGKVDTLLDQLRDDGICDVTDVGAIEGAWFDAIASLLANVSAPDFGIPYSADAKTYWEKQLLRLTATGPSYQRLQAEYF